MSSGSTVRSLNGANMIIRQGISLHSLREASNFDVGTTASNGGLLSSNTTPLLEAINDATDGCQRILWAASNNDAVIFQVVLDSSFAKSFKTEDPNQDLQIKFRGQSAGTTDAPTFASRVFFDEGDTVVADTSDALTDAYAEHTITVESTDIPEDCTTITVELIPGAHTTDAVEITALWLEFFFKQRLANN